MELTDAGRAALEEDRRHRDGWLSGLLDDMSERERAVLRDAAVLLRRIADS